MGDYGADMVIQSLTKYYEGHDMMTGGAVISKDADLAAKVKWVQNVHGNIINPFAAFMILQTSKTMALRVKQQSANAQAIAEFLEKHPKVEKVNYPGLASHPQKALADKYHDKFLLAPLDVASGAFCVAAVDFDVVEW